MISQFPKDEKYCLADQMKRASYSIPANIVEGHSKNSKKEFSRFLYMARGSLDLEYISDVEFCLFTERLSELSYLVNQLLIKSLKSSTFSKTIITLITSKASKASKTGGSLP